MSSAEAASTPSSPALDQAARSERWAQLSDTVFQNVTTTQGLPNATVTALAQDGDGFIWVATQGGLARWDGYRFRTYRADARDPKALPHYYVHVMHTDRQGRLWIGTASGGLARYDREHDRFLRIPVGAEGTSHVSIRAIADDGSGGLWVATEGGLDHIDTATGAVAHVRHVPGDVKSLPDNSVRSVLVDRAGTLWVGTRKGLVLRNRDGADNTGFVPVRLPGTGSAAPIATCLLQTRDGRLWMGTKHGAFIIDPGTGLVRAVHESGPGKSTLAGEWVFSLAEAPNGEVWLGTSGQGIVTVDSKTMHTRRIRHDPLLPSTLANDSVLAILRDRAGALWVGTEQGLSGHDPRQTTVTTLFGQGSRVNGISDSVNSVMVSAEQLVWAGLHRNGIDVIDPVGARLAAIRPTGAPPAPGTITRSLANGSVEALADAADGKVYIGTSSGLYEADRRGSGLRSLAADQFNEREPIGALLSETGRLWIGTSNGLWVLSQHAGQPAAPIRPLKPERLTDKRVVALQRGSGDALWIGTRRGLNFYEMASDRLEQILPDENDPHALSTGDISTLLIDHRRRLWVGTAGGGINILTNRDAKGLPRFHRIDVNEGLPHANVDKLLEDSAGNVWASTEAGLARIDGNTLAVRSLGHAEGVAIQAYWANSGAATREGELLFGGVGGLTVVLPDRYQAWTYLPPVVVTEVRLGGKPADAFRFNGTAQAKVDPLIVAAEANSIAVDFAALDYSAPERNRYAYRLEGYDKDWIQTDATHRTAAYTNLRPGDYRLHLRGSNREGVWTERELAIPIHVLPAWYQTWWSRLIALLAAAAAMYAVVQLRTRYLRRRQRELESQVEQRTSELVAAQSTLLERNQELAYANALQEQHQSELTRFLAVASHDLRQPMHALNLYLGALSNFELPTSARPVLGNVRQCAQIMDDMFLALLDLSRLDAQVVEPHIEAFPMASLLSSIAVEFAPQARAKGLQLRVARCAAWVRSDTALVEQILRNLVANAVRYTDTGGILIGCRRRGDQLRLAVIDTGIGITADQHKAVFEEFCQLGNEGHDRTKGLGLGLAIVRRLARLLHTPITLVSEPGRGSMFAIDLVRAKPTAASSLETLAVEAHHVAPLLGELAGKTIVVVDDESSILDAMRVLLEQWRCTVVTASSAANAIAKLSQSEQVPDVLICDYRLNLHETGLDVIKALQDEFNFDIPALIVTGTITQERMHELAATGMPVLHKPVNALALYEELVTIIGKS